MPSVSQKKSDIKRRGKDKASWICNWREPDGTQKSKSCGSGPAGKKLARKLAEVIKSQLVLGVYMPRSDCTWKEFCLEYQRLVVAEMDLANSIQAEYSISHFERICQPRLVKSINSKTIAEYTQTRSRERGQKQGSTVSPATVNKELRYIKSMLSTACDWGHLAAVPRIRRKKVMQRIETYISSEEFTKLYAACGVASRPVMHNIATEVWWQAFLVTLYMTGWRMSEVLSLTWENVDLDKSTLFSPAEEQKGRRDEILKLHPVIVEHLKSIRGFEDKVFPFTDGNRLISKRRLFSQFHLIQDAAGVQSKIGYYGFHDLRRGFATENAASMDLFELQKLMKHRDLSTTKKYVAMSHRNQPIDQLKVPYLRKKA